MRKPVLFDILEKNEIGAVALCNQCTNLHIEIGAFTTVVNQESFEKISHHLSKQQDYADKLQVQTPTGQKNLIAVSDHVFLSLDLEEYRQVVELFEMTLHVLNIREILEV